MHQHPVCISYFTLQLFPVILFLLYRLNLRKLLLHFGDKTFCVGWLERSVLRCREERTSMQHASPHFNHFINFDLIISNSCLP